MDYLIKDNVQLHIINTNKYKTVSTYLNFFLPLNEIDHASGAILSNMLGDKSVNYPSKQDVSNYKDNLFGAGFGVGIVSYGKGMAFQVITKMLNNRFAHTDLLNEQFKLMHEFFYHSILDEDAFLEAKEITKAYISRRLDKPMTYAINEAVKLIGDGYPFAYSIRPSLEVVNDITLNDVINYYNKLINEAKIDFYVLGDVDVERCQLLFNQYFNFSDRSYNLKSSYILSRDSLLKKEEVKKVDQSSVVMIYETNIMNATDDYYVLKAANCLFGQVPTSLLFQEIREMRSLCYNIYSQVLAYEGLVFVACGIDGKNADEVINLIEKQRQRIIDGEFDDDVLKDSLNLYSNNLNSSSDDIRSTLDFEYSKVVLNQNRDLLEVSNKIKNVTASEVQEIFKKLKLKCIYILKGDCDE